VYEDGPTHVYVAPATVVDVNCKVLPLHIGLLLPALGVTGVGFTNTVVPTAIEGQLFFVAMSV